MMSRKTGPLVLLLLVVVCAVLQAGSGGTDYPHKYRKAICRCRNLADCLNETFTCLNPYLCQRDWMGPNCQHRQYRYLVDRVGNPGYFFNDHNDFTCGDPHDIELFNILDGGGKLFFIVITRRKRIQDDDVRKLPIIVRTHPDQRVIPSDVLPAGTSLLPRFIIRIKNSSTNFDKLSIQNLPKAVCALEMALGTRLGMDSYVGQSSTHSRRPPYVGQSSTHSRGPPDGVVYGAPGLALDGLRESTCSNTDVQKSGHPKNKWWVRFPVPMLLNQIVVYGRNKPDELCNLRKLEILLTVADQKTPIRWGALDVHTPSPIVTWRNIPQQLGNKTVTSVTIQNSGPKSECYRGSVLTLCEVEIFGDVPYSVDWLDPNAVLPGCERCTSKDCGTYLGCVAGCRFEFLGTNCEYMRPRKRAFRASKEQDSFYTGPVVVLGTVLTGMSLVLAGLYVLAFRNTENSEDDSGKGTKFTLASTDIGTTSSVQAEREDKQKTVSDSVGMSQASGTFV